LRRSSFIRPFASAVTANRLRVLFHPPLPEPCLRDFQAHGSPVARFSEGRLSASRLPGFLTFWSTCHPSPCGRLCRVAGEHCCSPAPSERHVNLSVYAAQASRKAPRGTRWGASTPPARYWSGAGGRQTPETAPAASCRHLLCLLSQLVRRSRAETPEGSQPAFAEGDLARRLNPYPPDYGVAFASSLLLYPPSHRRPPYGGPTQREDDGLTTFHGRITDGLGSACSPVARTATAGKGEHPCTWPRTFWFKPVSAFGLSVLTAFISSSPELALPSTLAPDRLGVSSRRLPSREDRPPRWGEVTLSQELRTAGLLRPHVLVGYRW
jgi:hypothetical protein